MRDEVRSLLDTLTAGIAADESMAQECAELAHIAEQDGNQGFADTLRILSRHHRIRSLGRGGKIAVLNAKYGDLLDRD